MESVLLVVHLIVAIGIITLVLLQPSENDGFMGTGSMSNLMTARRGGDALSRATSILAALFFITSLFLAIASSKRPAVKSILDDGTAATTPALTVKTTQTTPATPAPEKDAGAKKADKSDKSDKAEKAEKTPKAPVAK